jgi:pimeloyl-ACP methyl ester carboxylesterase
MSVETSHPSAAPGSIFGQVAQIEAGVLDVGYVDAGPRDGPAVLLLHGWPYDIHSFAEVVPILAADGRRVIVRYLRGHGSTRFTGTRLPICSPRTSTWITGTPPGRNCR